MWKTTEGWKVSSVKREDRLNWVIELEHDGEGVAGIKICEYDFINQMHELFDRKRTRLYFSYGMRDIDVYWYDGSFVVMHSIHEGSYVQHVMSKEEFSKMLDMIDIQSEKTA